MSSRWIQTLCIALVVSCFQPHVFAMGLRSFVALPVEKGGTVWRGVVSHDNDNDANRLATHLAYGIDHRKTLLFGVPYQLSNSDEQRLGDVSVLYRQLVSQVDEPKGTSRFGFLGGAVVPTDSSQEGALQFGTVATWFRDRNEWDIDALYQSGSGNRRDSARYDLSWQHRLAPSVYPEWGIPPELYAVVELGGRWREGRSVLHQFTLGLQRAAGRWVLEGGVVQDLNGSNNTQIIVSIRFH